MTKDLNKLMAELMGWRIHCAAGHQFDAIYVDDKRNFYSHWNPLKNITQAFECFFRVLDNNPQWRATCDFDDDKDVTVIFYIPGTGYIELGSSTQPREKLSTAIVTAIAKAMEEKK